MACADASDLAEACVAEGCGREPMACAAGCQATLDAMLGACVGSAGFALDEVQATMCQGGCAVTPGFLAGGANQGIFPNA